MRPVMLKTLINKMEFILWWLLCIAMILTGFIGISIYVYAVYTHDHFEFAWVHGFLLMLPSSLIAVGMSMVYMAWSGRVKKERHVDSVA